MLLQGLELATEDDLLRKVVQRKLSLKELRQAANNIKNKIYVVAAFLKFTGEEDWESLQKRFPHHATEEKLAQFNGVPLKKNKASPTSVNTWYVPMEYTSFKFQFINTYSSIILSYKNRKEKAKLATCTLNLKLLVLTKIRKRIPRIIHSA